MYSSTTPPSATRRQDLRDFEEELEDKFSKLAIEPDIEMATKTLEARFEHLSVNDENEPAQNGSTMLKSKVIKTDPLLVYDLTTGSKGRYPQQCP